MKYPRSFNRSLYFALMLCALLPRDASATATTGRAVQFYLCSANVRRIILTKVPGSEKNWEFVIILNEMGTKEFRELEEAIPGHLVDIVWAGFSFGRRPLDLHVQPDAKRLVLSSKWFSFRAGQANFELLKKKLLQNRNSTGPCGVG